MSSALDCVVRFFVIQVLVFLILVCSVIAQHGRCAQRNLSSKIGRYRLRESGQNGQIAIVPQRVSGHCFKRKTNAKITRKRTTQSTGTDHNSMKAKLTSYFINFRSTTASTTSTESISTTQFKFDTDIDPCLEPNHIVIRDEPERSANHHLSLGAASPICDRTILAGWYR